MEPVKGDQNCEPNFFSIVAGGVSRLWEIVEHPQPGEGGSHLGREQT